MVHGVFGHWYRRMLLRRVALLGGRQTNVHQASVTHYLALVGKAETKIHVFKTDGLATPSASGLTEMFVLG
ncbi:MAG: hypothetical protein QGI92_04000 [Dehalococcoidales bacterium]|nr:hypothetical protein [Dehalococcoidales bacterium]MDP7109904.1 hypothetical protein [Dehalococcoidales bacterium]MDP7309813.1 hypothetical protein [Dehalococcoidales bacterium]MDP7409781.1 hypothetical protein [Dehalococcoidales bacterium]MDP7676124.1 hypothetical protein [Dehalococcoidales bacterium]